MKLLKLGITGGIGSGKSTASNFFKEKNAYIFNADRESKKHLKSSLSLQKKIINIFGNKITQNNKIYFPYLAEVAFENKTNQEILNGIMWPEILLIISNTFKEIKEENKYKLFIVDAALIFEANYQSFFDYTLLITANKKIRTERAIKRRNISLENIQNRMALQMSDRKKTKIADYIIKNNYSMKKFTMKLEEFYSNTLFK